jgi:acetyl-CoA C-acetyltransferase
VYKANNHSLSLRRVVIAGSARLPFCRSNTAYAELSNLDMLADTLQQLSDQCGLANKKIDEVVAGAVTSHSKDWNLAREAVLSTDLSPATPGITLQMACGTSLQAALMSAAKIASGQIDCAIAAGTDTTSDAPIVFQRRFARRLIKLGQARSLKARLQTFKGFRLAELTPMAPANGEPRTGLSMGQHCELMAREWGISRADQDQLALDSHLKAAAAYDAGFFDNLVMSYEGVARDNNLRADSSLEKLLALKPAFDRKHGTLTAGNSTPLTDGAAAVLLCSEDWALANNLPVLAYLSAGRSSAIDFVGGEGLLMAPTIAVSELLTQTGLSLQDFDCYEIHEAFAAQALCTLKAWEDVEFCRHKLGRDHALGSIDRHKMNIKGGSLAFGHPFAATGARILGTLAAILEEKGSGRGLISVCTAGGMGVAAVVERP